MRDNVRGIGKFFNCIVLEHDKLVIEAVWATGERVAAKTGIFVRHFTVIPYTANKEKWIYWPEGTAIYRAAAVDSVDLGELATTTIGEPVEPEVFVSSDHFITQCFIYKTLLVWRAGGEWHVKNIETGENVPVASAKLPFPLNSGVRYFPGSVFVSSPDGGQLHWYMGGDKSLKMRTGYYYDTWSGGIWAAKDLSDKSVVTFYEDEGVEHGSVEVDGYIVDGYIADADIYRGLPIVVTEGGVERGGNVYVQTKEGVIRALEDVPPAGEFARYARLLNGKVFYLVDGQLHVSPVPVL